MNMENCALLPANLAEVRLVHFSAVNIDITDSTLDGKKTFHSTQNAAWQRGLAPTDLLKNMDCSKQIVQG